MCVGCGEGAWGANRDEAGDGVVHEDAREGHLWKTWRFGGAQTAVRWTAYTQPWALR